MLKLQCLRSARRFVYQVPYPLRLTISRGFRSSWRLAQLAELKVLFGSQTGTAQSFAQQLGDNVAALPHRPKVTVEDLFEHSALPLMEELNVVFVVSCFGKGEPTDSAKRFYAWLMDPARLPVQGLRYAVFGCGSSKASVHHASSQKCHSLCYYLRQSNPLCYCDIDTLCIL
jgi:sulfite reductase alpha subunit-like flavoprotein